MSHPGVVVFPLGGLTKIVAYGTPIMEHLLLILPVGSGSLVPGTSCSTHVIDPMPQKLLQNHHFWYWLVGLPHYCCFMLFLSPDRNACVVQNHVNPMVTQELCFTQLSHKYLNYNSVFLCCNIPIVYHVVPCLQFGGWNLPPLFPSSSHPSTGFILNPARVWIFYFLFILIWLHFRGIKVAHVASSLPRDRA